MISECPPVCLTSSVALFVTGSLGQGLPKPNTVAFEPTAACFQWPLCFAFLLGNWPTMRPYFYSEDAPVSGSAV